MHKYNLGQLSQQRFVTDGGAETTLIFHHGLQLPEFAAFVLLKSDEGISLLQDYYRLYASIAAKYRVGFILESVTWRASAHWGRKLGYSDLELAAANCQAIELLEGIRDEFSSVPMFISGCLGPRDDGYNPADFMTVAQAERYHRVQIETFKGTAANMVSALTMTYFEEALGITQAAKSLGVPVVISFTLETNGKLPSGQPLSEAIQTLDEASACYPTYYMINCAHPTHFENILQPSDPFLQRVRGLRANASALSHAQLDDAQVLDDGNPSELAQQYSRIGNTLKNLNVLGGCCGTDHRHIEAIIKAVSR